MLKKEENKTMKEDTVELIDYLRVIWKRKILIVVITMACIAAAGIASKKKKIIEIYRAEAMISIGEKVCLPPGCNYDRIATADQLVEFMPFKYGQNGYLLSVVRCTPYIVKIAMQGPDGGVKESLKGVIDKLIADHIQEAEDSAKKQRVYMELFEEKIEERRLGIAQMEEKWKGNSIIGDDVTFTSTMATVQSLLLQMKNELGGFQREYLSKQLVVDGLRDRNTKMIDVVKIIKLPVKITKRSVVLLRGSILGIALSLSLAFFIEYIEKVRARTR